MPGKKGKQRKVGGKNFAKAVQKVIDRNIELKTVINTFAGTSISDAGTDTNLSGITQGDSQVNRDGNQLKMRSLSIRGWFNGADATNNYRVIVYRPRNDTDDLTSLTYYGAPDLDAYVIYRDVYYHTSQTGMDTAIVNIHMKFKGSGKTVQYDGATASDCKKNMVRVIMFSDSSSIGHPTFYGYSRVNFTDA